MYGLLPVSRLYDGLAVGAMVAAVVVVVVKVEMGVGGRGSGR